MDVSVAAGSNANGNVFFAMLGKDVGQRWRKKNLASFPGYLGQLRLQRRNRLMGFKIPHHQGIGGQAMPSRVAPGDDAGGVSPGDGGEHRMVIGESHSFSDQRREVGHQRRSYLRWLKAIENDYQYGMHITFSSRGGLW
jgi:hypothetical protein